MRRPSLIKFTLMDYDDRGSDDVLGYPDELQHFENSYIK
jgi:hypothetical protein